MQCSDLAVKHRTLRTLPGKLLLGSAGARLMADYLTEAAGFEGRIDVVHKMNIPLLFRVDVVNDGALTSPRESVWYPDRLEMHGDTPHYTFTEHKWITWNDCAISFQQWHNKNDTPLQLHLSLPDNAVWNADDSCWEFRAPHSIHSILPVFAISSSVIWDNGAFTIPAHAECEIVMQAACVLSGEEGELKHKLSHGVSGAALENEHRQSMQKWYSLAPTFHSDSTLLNQTWLYRWYILRNSMAQPDTGFFHHKVMYEGRSHKVVKTPWQPSGWEFTKLVPLSTPLHIMDLEWHGDTNDVYDIIRSLIDSADENGIWRCLYADERLSDYANCSAYGLYKLYLRTGDLDFIREVLPAFKKNCMEVYNRHKGDNDHLQIEYIHQLTGKEYQPSYWYFADAYPDKVNKITDDYTPLKRVDRSVYAYLDFKGLSQLCRAIGDAQGDTFAQLADAIRVDILEKMWDPDTHFFYDLHYKDDRKAMVKNVVGFYPYWAGITDQRHIDGLKLAWDEQLFALGSGFASVAADCPVFSACGGWKGNFFKGRNGCVWNGPSWPYTTAILLDAIGTQSRQNGHAFDAQFARFLREYCLQHFKGGDVNQPYLVEHYDSITGEPLSDEPDYNHSYYLDLIVRYVAGIHLTQDGLDFEPLDCGLNDFELCGINACGHKLKVSLSAGRYRLYIDDEQAITLRIGEYKHVAWAN